MDDLEIERRVNILESTGGIQAPYEAFYIESILSTAISAGAALNRFYDYLETNNTLKASSSLHEFLVHSAAISRYFFPSRTRGKNPINRLFKLRGIKLRKAFGIEEGSPLASRKLRDALEHYDERLDKYLLGDIAGNFFPNPIIDHKEKFEESLSFCFKLIDPAKHIYVLFGEEFEFSKIALELREIYNTAKRMSENGGRLDISS